MTVTDADLRETVEYLREIMRDLGTEILFSQAINIIRQFDKMEFLNITDDYFNWPYSGAKSEFSFADELFWVFKQSFIQSLAEMGFESVVRSACSDKFYSLSGAEMAFLSEVFSPSNPSGGSQIVVARLMDEVLRIVGDYDKEVLREAG